MSIYFRKVVISVTAFYFLKNVFTGVEYAFDIITTVSGVGKLIKVGRLLRILNKSKTLIGKTKRLTWVITGVKRVTGFIEVTSGTANTLMKLTGFNDTELGKSISKYLFYLEMVCLAGEASVLLYGKLQKTAKRAKRIARTAPEGDIHKSFLKMQEYH